MLCRLLSPSLGVCISCLHSTWHFKYRPDAAFRCPRATNSTCLHVSLHTPRPVRHPSNHSGEVYCFPSLACVELQCYSSTVWPHRSTSAPPRLFGPPGRRCNVWYITVSYASIHEGSVDVRITELHCLVPASGFPVSPGEAFEIRGERWRDGSSGVSELRCEHDVCLGRSKEENPFKMKILRGYFSRAVPQCSGLSQVRSLPVWAQYIAITHFPVSYSYIMHPLVVPELSGTK